MPRGIRERRSWALALEFEPAMAAMPIATIDLSSVVPVRAPDDLRSTGSRRLATAAADALAALFLNAVAAAFVIRFAFPETAAIPAPEVITVELVQAPPAPRAEVEKAAKTALPALPSPAPPPADKPAAAIPQPPQNPPPAAVVKQAAAAPQDNAAATEPSPSTGTAVPPPLEGDDGLSRPHLVEAPQDPRRAAQQAERPTVANELKEPTDRLDVSQDRQAAPDVMATPETDQTVPRPAPKPADKPPTPVSAEDIREAESTATLAAALPFNPTIMSDTMRAALSGSGSAAAQAYRGVVYGNFHKADGVVEAARAKHLRGQAVVAFTIDDAGAVASARIAMSSGVPEVDQVALDIIRQGAPYPPPPPGAQRSFAPAIALGLDGP